MMYRPAPEVADLAADLIDTVDDHADLDGFRIVYVFIDKAPKAHGRVVLGRARKITGLSAFLARTKAHEIDTFQEPQGFGVVEISEDHWHNMSGPQRLALVDHELCHFYVHENDDGSLELSTRGHDVEEFVGIIKRHGLWKSDLSEMGAAVFEQLSLDITTGAEQYLRATTEPALADGVKTTLVSDSSSALASTAPAGVTVASDRDPLYETARKLVVDRQNASVRLVYGTLNIGPARANLIMDQLEAGGVVSAKAASGRRDVLERWSNE